MGRIGKQLIAIATATALLLAGLTVRAEANHEPVEPNPCGVDGHRESDPSAGPLPGDLHVWVEPDGYVGISGSTFYSEVDASERREDGLPVVTYESSGSNGQMQQRIGHEDRLYCIQAGPVQVGPGGAVYPVTASGDPVPMPHLRRSDGPDGDPLAGDFWQAPDGRTTILHGVDYAYDQCCATSERYNLTDPDFARIASWGMNVLRIRLKGYRAGYMPRIAPEPGYLENLDRIIEGANRHGLYVIVTWDGHSLESSDKRLHDPTFEQAKFLPDTAAREQWLDYAESIFERYAHWPGVVGFDAIKEDYAYPPYIHDRVFMRLGHEALLERLRDVETRTQTPYPKVYFQQPAGWSYWSTHDGVGHDLDDPNRNFCTLFTGHQQQGLWTLQNDEDPFELRMQEMEQWARDAGTKLFICEWTMYAEDDEPETEAQLLPLQRRILQALDRNLIGYIRNVYQPTRSGYNSLMRPGDVERFFVRELVRPYPMWVGGWVTSIEWDFEDRILDLGLDLNATGPTEVFVSPSRTYPEGFVATTSDGGYLEHDGDGVLQASGLSWDPSTSRLVIPTGSGEVSMTIAPRSV